MADLNNLQAAQTIKIAGANSTGLETGFVGASSDGKLSITNIAPSGVSGFTHGKVTTSTIASVRNTTYTEQTTDAQRSFVSSSTSDTAAGTGARTIRITYLDASRNGNFTEELTLNGTTAVNTVNTNICFIEKIEVLTSGSFGANQGVISLKAATAGGGVTIWSIAISDNVTYGAHHYITAGKTGYIQSLCLGASPGDTALFWIIFTNPLTGATSARIDEISISTGFLRRYENPLPIPGEFFRYLVVVSAGAAGTYYASIEHHEA